jgi:hypothetical protein
MEPSHDRNYMLSALTLDYSAGFVHLPCDFNTKQGKKSAKRPLRGSLLGTPPQSLQLLPVGLR